MSCFCLPAGSSLSGGTPADVAAHRSGVVLLCGGGVGLLRGRRGSPTWSACRGRVGASRRVRRRVGVGRRRAGGRGPGGRRRGAVAGIRSRTRGRCSAGGAPTGRVRGGCSSGGLAAAGGAGQLSAPGGGQV